MCSKFSLLIVLITIWATTQADVKHLSKKYLPPATNSFNGLTLEKQRNFDEDGAGKIVNGASAAAAQTTGESQDPVPFPGPFIPTPGGVGGVGGFGFPNAGSGFPNFPTGPTNNFLPGAIPNFPQQANFQGFPAAGFQPNFGLNQPGAGFQQGFPQAGAFGQPFQQTMPQFGNQAFPGAFPGFQAPQFGFQQPGFGFNNQLQKSNDDVGGTVYGSNNGYVYEKPTN